MRQEAIIKNMSEIKRTALNRACEEIENELKDFQEFSAGLSVAYGYPMDIEKKGIVSEFTVIPDSRILCWNRSTHHTMVKFEQYTTKAKCKAIIRKAIKKVEKTREMSKQIQAELNQDKLL